MNRRSRSHRHSVDRADKIKLATKWVLFVLISIVLYALQTTPGLTEFSPILLIPFALSVTMLEHLSKLSCAFFGAWCGLLLDMASNSLLGFNAILLMAICVAASLLVTHLIRPYIVNMLWLCFGAVSIIALMDFFFRFVIWDYSFITIIFKGYTIPVIISTTLLSPLLLLLVRMLFTRLGVEEEIIPEEVIDDD